MTERMSVKSEKKWEFTKIQAIIVMGIGSLLLIPSLLISTEPNSTVHSVKVAMGFIGVMVIFIGLWRRPMNAVKAK